MKVFSPRTRRSLRYSSVFMPITQAREIAAASRLENVRYAIRDLAVVADELTRQGHRILPLNIGDPINFDFETPPHLIETVHKAMKDGKNGYAPSQGIPQALEAIRAEAARKGITSVQDAFVTTGVSETVDICLAALLNPGEDILTPSPDYPLYSAVLAKLGTPITTYDLNERSEERRVGKESRSRRVPVRARRTIRCS